MPINRRQFLFIFSSIAFFRVPLIDAQSKYSATVAVLRRAHINEIQAHLNYLSYAEKAKLENYPGLAYFFYSFALAESVHARNFNRILSALGVQSWEPPKPVVKVFSSKVNLKSALEFEMLDIDRRYPQFVEEAKPEAHGGALENLNYAWDTEKQHRDLIQKMQSGTGIFFGVIASLSAVAIALIVAAFSKTEKEAFLWGNIIAIPIIFLSGIFFPLPEITLFNFGDTPFTIFDLQPTTHAHRAFLQVFLYGAGIGDLLYELTMLLAVTALYFGIGVILYRRFHLKMR